MYTYGDNITISADASDPDGSVTVVEFYEGSTKLGEDTTAPYSFTWQNVPHGTYILTVRAKDNDNRTGYSAPVNIDVKGPGITIQENETGFCSYDGTVDNNNSGYTGSGYVNTYNAIGNGISWKIYVPTFTAYTLRWRYANGAADRPASIILDGRTIISSYNFASSGAWDVWDVVSVNLGLKAGIRDIRIEGVTAGGLANIDYLEVAGVDLLPANCTGNNPPIVTLTAPLDGSEFTEGDDILITADAFDMDGTISKVEFYNGPTKLGESAFSPYYFEFYGTDAGSCSFTAKAYDNEGAAATSAPGNVTVRLYGDFTKNSTVDEADLADYMSYWLETDCQIIAPFDLHADCIINLVELKRIAKDWLRSY